MTPDEADALWPGDWFMNARGDRYLCRSAAFWEFGGLRVLARMWWPVRGTLGGKHSVPTASMARCEAPEGYAAVSR